MLSFDKDVNCVAVSLNTDQSNLKKKKKQQPSVSPQTHLKTVVLHRSLWLMLMLLKQASAAW